MQLHATYGSKDATGGGRMTPEEFAGAFAEIHPAFEPQAAAIEANRCLNCFDAPCTAACPTHIDVPRFIKKIASGNLRGSALTILDANILGLSCSRVCPVDVLCEGACVMHRYNKRPIEIGRLQRRAMDAFYSAGADLAVPPGASAKSVACIGAGPASLACAAELRMQGIAATVFEARPMAGGLNTYGVAEYKLRPPDSLREVALVRSLGVAFRNGVSVGADITLEALESGYDAIFVGIGLGPTESIGIPGEDLDGVVDAVRFIAEYKTGTPKIGNRVVVVGGGNTAIDAAVASRLLGAEQVTIAYRRDENAMPAFAFEYEHAKQQGIRFVWQALPTAIVAGKDGRAASLQCLRTTPGQPDASGRRHPEPIAGSEFTIACDTVVVALGQTKLFRLLEGRGIEFSAGCVRANRATGQTANRKYFAAGDCVNGGGEVVDAVADGKRAGRGIAEWLGQHG
ncbi:MAG: NAD(P)-dependent oxidoreductase [Bryobacteraceae bacterium]